MPLITLLLTSNNKHFYSYGDIKCTQSSVGQKRLLQKQSQSAVLHYKQMAMGKTHNVRFCWLGSHASKLPTKVTELAGQLSCQKCIKDKSQSFQCIALDIMSLQLPEHSSSNSSIYIDFWLAQRQSTDFLTLLKFNVLALCYEC